MSERELHVPMQPNEEEQLLATAAPNPSVCKSKEVVDKYFPQEEKPTLKTDKSFATRFKIYMMVVIIVNGLTLGAMSQWPECKTGPINIYLLLNSMAALSYVAEVIIKMRMKGVKEYFWDGGRAQKWNITDFTLTIISLMEVTGMACRGLMSASVIMHVLEPLSVLRLARLIRIIHLLEDIPALTVTIGGVFGSLEPLGWIVVALLFICYVFAIFFHLMVQKCEGHFDKEEDIGKVCSDSYRTLFTGMQTLINVVVLINWTETIPMSQRYLLGPFYMWVLSSTFGIVNVIIGVMVDATADTKHKLEWSTKRKSLITIGKMWEDEIHSRGLSREALAKLSEEERAVKQTTRRAAVRQIIAELIDSGLISFPPGTEPEEVRLVLDKNGDGRVSHEEFTLGLGRILLADPMQQSIMTFINQGTMRRNTKEIHENWDKLTEDIDKNNKKYENLSGVLGEMKQRIEKLQQAVQEIKPQKKK